LFISDVAVISGVQFLTDKFYTGVI